MKNHVVLVVEGDHGAEKTREVRLNLPETLAWDIERYIEGSPDAVYAVLLASALRHWREGSTHIGSLGINAKEFLWKHGYILTDQEKTVLDRWERGEIPALEAVELLLKDHHGDTLAIQARSLSPDPLVPLPNKAQKPGQAEADAFLRRLKGTDQNDQ